MSAKIEHAVVPAKARYLPPDIEQPQFADLFDLSLLRILDAAEPRESPPPRLFPTSETFFGNGFTFGDWMNHGRLELEFVRMKFTLLNIQERSMPASMVPVIRLILASNDVLRAWRRNLPRIRLHITKEIRQMVRVMKKSGDLLQDKSAYLVIPKDYKTHATGPKLSLQLLRRALAEVIDHLRNGKSNHARQFLEIYSFLKDPLGGLEKPFEDATAIFVQLILSARRFARKGQQSLWALTSWNFAAAQAAHEALFLSDPLIQAVSHVHFSHHHQLCYVRVKLDEIPRSEFSIASHVVRVLEEIITAPEQADSGSCTVPPIAVATYPALARQTRHDETIIIDGNHRAAATMILRFVAEYPEALAEGGNSLSRFCHSHRLGIKWEIDLADVMHTLRQSSCLALLQQNWDTVRRFRHVDSIPALVVQEADFHTACQQRPRVQPRRPHALLPVHQALYNDSELGLAFPQAGQVHGRTPGFKAMALLPADGTG